MMTRIVFALLLLSSFARGTTYYVSTSGSDSNAGTATQPWLTPAHASSVAVAGDTVLFYDGTYVIASGTTDGDWFINTNSGTSGNPITFKSLNQWGAKLVGQGTGDGSTVIGIGVAWINVQGFDVTGSDANGIILASTGAIASNNQAISNYVHDMVTPCDSNSGTAIETGAGSAYTGISNNNIIGNLVVNIVPAPGVSCHLASGIYMLVPNAIVANNIVINAGTNIQSWHAATNETVFGNVSINGQFGIIIGAGDSPGGVTNDNSLVQNNIVINNSSFGIQEEGSTGIHNQYIDNLVFTNGTNISLQNGLTATGTVTADPKFVNNTGLYNGDYRLQSSSPARGAGLALSSVLTDFAGNARPSSGATDIGAYIYSSATGTVATVTISPRGFTIPTDGVTLVGFSVTCTYTSGSPGPDGCEAGGGATWSSPTRALNSSGGTVANGVAKWSSSYNPADNTIYNGAQTAVGVVHVCAQSICDTAQGQGDPAISVSNIAIASNVVTLTVANSIPTVGAGQRVSFYGLTAVPALNGQFVTITTANATTLTFPFTNANVSSTAETGHAILPLNPFTTPSLGFYQNTQPGTFYTPTLGVGAKMQVGAGFTFTSTSPPNPFQWTCNWITSNSAVATVDRFGSVTAVAPGSVSFTCNQAGAGSIDTNPSQSSLLYGPISVTNPTPTLQTWYVRKNGGTPFVNSTQTPSGQCTGLADVDYPGSGPPGQACAVGNLSYLWLDQVTANSEQWMIGPGDTVIVRQNSSGYEVNLTAPSPSYGGSVIQPINCGNADCFMPTIPSGTSAHHTKILGENFAACQSNSAKTLLYGSYAGKYVFNVQNSQYVDIACFEVTDQSDCGYGGTFSPQCKNTALNYVQSGVLTTAMSSFDTFTDINIHGVGFEGFHGATGDGSFTLERVRIQVPFTGFDTDDDPNGQTNISVAGGITMNDSLTEFTGCVEEFPVAHNYPYVTCLDQNGGQGDGFGTANTSGTWNFNNDIWRYNYQDGLDLLHSNSQFITVTNSLSYGSLGDQFKLGPGNVTVFQNNYMNANCQRIGFPIGDEPFTPMPSFYDLCRAAGDLIVSENSYGSVTVQNNTMLGYANVAVQIQCGAGFDNCSTNNATFQNNVIVGNATASGYNGGSNTSALCTLNVSLQNDCNGTPSSFPTNQGFTTRTNNIYQGMFHCPTTVLASEDCNPGVVGFQYVQSTNTLPFTLAGEELMDPYNINGSYTGYLTGTNAGWYPTSGGLVATFGTPISGLTHDSVNYPYNVSTPSIGNLQLESGAVSAPTNLKGVILKGVKVP